ncbi:MAG TPA: hypothetical protein VHE78_18835 [Gemmatimonadaceae bacterium]|nr:hypothetical protein [Gemmatimonadaceae bacterium]
MAAVQPDAFAQLHKAGAPTIRSYEDAATAIGRLDGTASLAPKGLRELLVLRCIVTPSGASRRGMLALLHPDGDMDSPLRSYAAALRTGAASARGGVVPSLEVLRDLLGSPSPGGAADTIAFLSPSTPVSEAAIIELMRDTPPRPPPLLKAAMTAGALLASSGGSRGSLASLATSLVLCVGGATTDAWLTLPLAGDGVLAQGPSAPDWNEWLGRAFRALAGEARAAERGLADARRELDIDQARVRDAFGRAAYSALDVLELLANQLVITVPGAARTLGQTPPTAGAAVARLAELGIASEITGRSRSRAFVYAGLVDALAPALAATSTAVA